jgi:uncharacterized SAM-binding protein YcdF (DUF218 family)
VNIVEQAAKLFVPGSLSLLVIAAAVGMVLVSLRGRLARVGRTLLIVTAIVYGALSTPAVASLVERPLVHEYAPLDDRAAAAPVPAIVVLGNGVFVRGAEPDIVHVMHLHTAENVIEGARLFTLLAPRYVVVSGGIPNPSSQSRAEADVMQEALVRFGVPADRILREGTSRNTYEQVVNVRRLLDQRRLGSFVVVTAATHMKRVLLLMNRQGLAPIPSVPLVASERRGARGRLFSAAALGDSQAASYEYLALAGYWISGRL